MFQKLQLYKNFSQRFCHFIWWILQSPFLLLEEDSSDIWKLKPLEVLAANPAVSFHSSRVNRLEFRASGVLCRHGQPPGAGFCHLLESRHWVLGVWGGSSMTSQAWDDCRPGSDGGRSDRGRECHWTWQREPVLQILWLYFAFVNYIHFYPVIFQYCIPNPPFGEHWTTSVSFHGSRRWNCCCWLGKEDTPQCLLFAEILSHFPPLFFFLIPWGENLQTITLSPVTFHYKMCFLQTDILEPTQASNLALFCFVMFWAGRLPHNAVLYMEWNRLCFHLKFQCLVLKILTWTH